jgi:hypothetical protein
LVSSTRRLLASKFGSSQITVRTCIGVRRQREVYSDLVLARQVGVGNFGIGHFESGAIRDVEGKFSFAKVGFAPVPAAEGMLAIVQIYAVPCLEHLCNPVKIVGLESI